MKICPFIIQTGGVTPDAAVVAYPGPTAAYFSMFHSPTSVDSRAVQLGGVMTFFIAVACTVFAGRYVTEWVVSWWWCPCGGLSLPMHMFFG